jgi:hypothetical protein
MDWKAREFVAFKECKILKGYQPRFETITLFKPLHGRK